MRYASKTLYWSTPKSNADASIHFPADHPFIFFHYLCRTWMQHQIQQPPGTSSVESQRLSCTLWGKHFSTLFREAKEYTKFSTVIKSHANKAKALCCNLLQVPSEVFSAMLGLGSGQHVNKDKRKTVLTSGHFTYIGHIPATLNMEVMVLFLLNQNS